MQTSTSRGMMTMEQSLANLIFRRVITRETALSCTSRPEQLEGLLERAGYEEQDPAASQVHVGLRMAGS
jgi:Tfp pilus assembly ATPase PilU